MNNTLNPTPTDLIRLLDARSTRLSQRLTTLQGQHQSVLTRTRQLEEKLLELENLRELDRAKLTQMSAQILEVTSSQVEVLTGGLRGQPPEPAEALASLAGHAGIAIFKPIGLNIAAALSLLVLGGIAAPVFKVFPLSPPPLLESFEQKN